jgi:protein-L-isoaspartate(D-aspartate) O-methyltransferase
MKQDTFLHKGLRQQMCATLRQKGITDERVLAALSEVPRHLFIGAALESRAYEDVALKIDCEQTISHPSTVAMQSQLLNADRGMRVLEIGTGSGYQTAVLCQMGLKVFTIERQKALYQKTSKLLKELGYRAQCFCGDGFHGLPGDYHRIIVTCGAPEIPEALMRQLMPEGVMVIPLGEEQQEMLRITKHGESREDWEIERFGMYKFVPMLDGKTTH